MITPGGTNTDEQAIRHVLENEFLTRAKSLSKYSEVYRFSTLAADKAQARPSRS
jgi:hypothetical protein